MQSLQDIMKDPLHLTPKGIIQLLRGRHYYYSWGLLANRIENSRHFAITMEYFKLSRALFIRYLQTVDFSEFNPLDIYANSMSALCSSYSEIVELAEMMTGVLTEFTEFRQFNVTYFNRDVFEREVHEWLEGDFLPVFGEIKYGTFPVALLVTLMVAVIRIVKIHKMTES